MANNHSKVCQLDFLSTLYGDYLDTSDLKLEIRCIPAKQDNPVIRRFYGTCLEFKKGWEELAELNQNEYHIFFGVALRRSTKQGHEVPNPVTLNCLWADIDVGPDKPNKSIGDAHTALRKLGSRPTIIVHSGHGVHAYWCFKKARTIDAETAKELLRAIAIATGGDLQSAEVARLLRMPNTINWKKKKDNVPKMPDPTTSHEAKQ